MKSLKKQLTITRLVLLTVIILAIGIFVFANRNVQTVIPQVSLYTVVKDDVVDRVQVQGIIAASESRSISIATGAKIIALDVSLGSNVSAGARIARIQKNNGLNNVEEDVTTPIAGTVVQLDLAVGDTVTTQPKVITVANISSYTASMQVNENDITNLATDQSAQIIIPAISLTNTYNGKVTKVGLTPISSGVVNYEVIVGIDNPPTNLRLGMSSDVTITTQTVNDVVAIPDSYVVEKDNKFYVKVLNWLNEAKSNYEIQEQEVQVGLRTSELSEIKSGLNTGSTIVAPSFVQPSSFSIFGGSN